MFCERCDESGPEYAGNVLIIRTHVNFSRRTVLQVVS
jgi:hypothetical protein